MGTPGFFTHDGSLFCVVPELPWTRFRREDGAYKKRGEDVSETRRQRKDSVERGGGVTGA